MSENNSKQERHDELKSIGLLLNSLVEDAAFLLLIKREDGSVDYTSNDNDAVNSAKKFLSLITKKKKKK